MISRLARFAAAALLLSLGCAGPGPRLFPVVPGEVRSLSDGGADRLFKTKKHGALDYCEHIDETGRVSVLRFDTNGDGEFDLDVPRASIKGDDRQLIILIDSEPFEVVRSLYEQGRFRLFYPPSRTISPFPVMTDLSFSEFFGVSPCPGAESEFYDGKKLEGGYTNYVHQTNEPWLKCVDYDMANVAHAFAYYGSHAWFDHELHYIQKYFMEGCKSPYIGYCVGTSCVGAQYGRDGHQAAMIRLDRMCERIMHDTQGRVQITLMSDHGHNMMASKRVPIGETLERCGYRVSKTLKKRRDVVVPEFGTVTCAVIYTLDAEDVARDVVGIEGVVQTMYLDSNDEVVVLCRGGRARISHKGDSFRYVAEMGDPLHMMPFWGKLVSDGKADAAGFVRDDVLFDATKDHEYPDSIHRIWRAFHGLMQHTPQVMVAVADGYHCGSKLMSEIYSMQAAHGNLGMLSSSGVVITTAGRLPPVMRMQDLANELRKVGVPVPQGEPLANANADSGARCDSSSNR
ncbi:MAG TPA: hypothetical protein VMV81_06735 [Phycisphaerae bacterium]|nr:hypothetical protein [Phycisphaerae bacterium]